MHYISASKKVRVVQVLFYYVLLATLRETRPNTEFFSGPYFPVFALNTGKYGPEKTPYLDTFHAVLVRDYNSLIWEAVTLNTSKTLV